MDTKLIDVSLQQRRKLYPLWMWVLICIAVFVSITFITHNAFHITPSNTQSITTISNVKFGYRRDVKYLSEDEKEEIKLALYKMKKVPSRFNNSFSSWDYFVFVHAQSIQQVKSHFSWAFLPWHRVFQYMMEQEINLFMNRSDDNPFKIPYWNPTDDESINATLWDTNFLGGNGDPDSNPPYLLPDEYAFGGAENWPLRIGAALTDEPGDYIELDNTTNPYQSLARWIGTGTMFHNLSCGSKLDDVSIWNNLYDIEMYDVEPYTDEASNWNETSCKNSFRGQLEGCNPNDLVNECPRAHATLHWFIGGHVADFAYSPNDPVFFMLHGWIDAVWAKWQDIHDANNFPQHLLDEILFDYGDFNNIEITARDVLDTKSLYYKYDIQHTQESDDNEWYSDFTKPWIYLFILCALLVILIISGMITCKIKRNKSEKQQKNLYENMDDNTNYGTNEKVENKQIEL